MSVKFFKKKKKKQMFYAQLDLTVVGVDLDSQN